MLRKLGLLAFLLLLLTGCGAGDDDGLRLGDHIVGTWLRGWGEGDVVVEGYVADDDDEDAPQWGPDNIAIDRFVFNGDGAYNGMVRSGSFTAWDTEGEIIYEGNYKCDNGTLKLEYLNGGSRQSIVCQIVSFTEDIMKVRYQNEDPNVSVTLTLRKSSE